MYIDHTDLVQMVKSLVDDVEKLKQNNAFYAARLDALANMISELKYKGQDD